MRFHTVQPLIVGTLLSVALVCIAATLSLGTEPSDPTQSTKDREPTHGERIQDLILEIERLAADLERRPPKGEEDYIPVAPFCIVSWDGQGAFVTTVFAINSEHQLVDGWTTRRIKGATAHIGPNYSPLPIPCPMDLDGSGTIDEKDVAVLLNFIGEECPPASAEE